MAQFLNPEVVMCVLKSTDACGLVQSYLLIMVSSVNI